MSAVGHRQSRKLSLFGSEPTEEEEEEEEQEDEEKDVEEEEEKDVEQMLEESAAYQFLPIIIKINNEIELTSELPPFYPLASGGIAQYRSAAIGSKRNAAGHATVVSKPSPPPSIEIYGDNGSEMTSSANSDSIPTGGHAVRTKGVGGGMSERVRTAVERFENSQQHIVCRHLEGSPSRRAGCCRHQCRPPPPNGGESGRKNGGSQLWRPAPANGGRRHRPITASASGPTGRPQLVRQKHLDMDIHPDLTRKRHSCVPTVWLGGAVKRHRRTESI
jgi:hypothetical protein